MSEWVLLAECPNGDDRGYVMSIRVTGPGILDVRPELPLVEWCPVEALAHRYGACPDGGVHEFRLVTLLEAEKRHRALG